MKITKEMKNKKTAKKWLNHTSHFTPHTSQKGITLIALIITIIVMLILVGVTISMAVNGGLFDYAGKAVGDTKNSIALEQELANGRIQIGGVWYNSIDDYLKGIPSGTQTEDDIIITASVIEETDGKYIDLLFQISGVDCSLKGLGKYLLDYIDNNNLYVDKTETELEDMIEEVTADTDEQIVFNEETRSQFLVYAETLGLNYLQFLKIQLNTFEDFSGFQIRQVNYMYESICKIANLEVYTEETAVEQQILDIAGYDGTIENYLISKGTSKAEIQSGAEELGVTYTDLLKSEILNREEKFFDLCAMNITVSNGSSEDSYVANPFVTTVPYQITVDGTYTFKAEMLDGSGRKGETTISTIGDLSEWVMAWTCTDGVWSDTIEKGGEIDGDVVAKLYRTGETVDPVEGSLYDVAAGVTYENGLAYKLVIELLEEGTGDLPVCSVDSVWHQYSAFAKANGADVDSYYPAYVTEVIIEDGITNIPSYAFIDFRSLQSVTIPESVTSIGEEAFSWCYALTNLSIPKNVNLIGKGAFSCCENLKEITIPEGVTTINRSLFDSCCSLSKVIFEGDVVAIGVRAFIGCESLTEITIPANVTTIGEYAFQACENLRSVTLPANITSIAENTFGLPEDAIIYVPNETVKALVEGAVGDSYTVTIQ